MIFGKLKRGIPKYTQCHLNDITIINVVQLRNSITLLSQQFLVLAASAAFVIFGERPSKEELEELEQADIKGHFQFEVNYIAKTLGIQRTRDPEDSAKDNKFNADNS